MLLCLNDLLRQNAWQTLASQTDAPAQPQVHIRLRALELLVQVAQGGPEARACIDTLGLVSAIG